jgi:hypothetical protein
MRSTEPIEVPPYLCTMSAIVVLNWRSNRAAALETTAPRHKSSAFQERRRSVKDGGVDAAHVQHARICPRGIAKGR